MIELTPQLAGVIGFIVDGALVLVFALNQWSKELEAQEKKEAETCEKP